MFIVFIRAFFIDWICILLIMVPIVAPFAPAGESDPAWYGMMLAVNL